MARSPQDITDAELAVMQALWKHGPSPIRRITEALYPDGRPSQYATVQKLLERLEDKECVRRDRGHSVHVFEAAIARDELVGRRLQAVAEQLCEGSWTPLLTHLMQSRKLSGKERQMLRQFIDDIEVDAPRKRDRRGGETK